MVAYQIKLVPTPTKGGKVNPSPFAHPNPSTLIELKPTQLLVGLNGHQPN